MREKTSQKSNVFEVEFFSQFLPYKTFDPKTRLYHNEQTSGFILKGRPMVGANLKDQNDLADFFRKLDYLKEGTSLQFLLVANPKCESILNWWGSHRQGAYKGLAQRRIDHLQKLTQQTPHHLSLVRDFQLYISLTVPYVAESLIEQEKLVEIRDTLQEKIRRVGVPMKVLEAPEFLQSFGEIINLTSSPTGLFPWNPYEDLSHQLCCPNQGFRVEKERLLTEKGQSFKAFVPKNRPQEWSLTLMDKFLGQEDREGLDFPYLLHYGLTICDSQSGEKLKAFGKRESLERSLKSQLAKLMPELKDHYEESLDVVEELQRHEQVCYAGLSVGIFVSPEKMPQAESRFLAHTQKLGFEFVPTTFTHFPLFLSQLPMMWTLKKSRESFLPWRRSTQGWGRSLFDLQRAKKTITKEAQNLLPILGEWTGQSSPGIPLVGRAGQLFFWNPYGVAFLPDAQNVQTTGNYNVSIVGQSGSGKSVFLQEMVNTVLGVGGKAFIFDYGRSFEKYCGLLGGQHITFDIGRPTSLNFFTNLPEESSSEAIKNRAEILNCISSTVKVMASHETSLSDLQFSYVEEAVDYVAKTKGRLGEVNDIREYLLKRSAKESKDVGQMLYSYSKEGMYGGFFNDQATMSLDKKLTVIETDELRNHPSLMSVCVQMMIIRINQMMLTSERRFPFMIVIDEAWQLLRGKGASDFIPQATRTARKYKGSIVLATQLLTDYFQESSPGATAAFNTSNWKLILNQPPDAIEGWSSHSQLKEFVATQSLKTHLKSIHSTPPHYSEIGIFNDDIKGVVGRLMLDPFSRILYSTNADEFRRVQEKTTSGLSLNEAIESVLQEQGEGRL